MKATELTSTLSRDLKIRTQPLEEKKVSNRKPKPEELRDFRDQ